MNYLIKSTWIITICLIEIILSQSIYNQQLYDQMLNNQVRGSAELQPNWISKENVIHVETILEGTISPEQYIVGPGDQFAINIISSDGVFNYILAVTPTSELLLPLIGLINIDQLSLISAIEKIKTKVNSTNKNAKIEITLIKLRKFKVLVTGAIEESGFVVISAIDRLSSAIKASGGFLPLAKEFNIEINHQDGTIDYINYLEYLRTGDISQNPIIKNGDHINIPFGKLGTESILIRGAIENNGYDIIEPEETLTSLIQRRIFFDENAYLDKIYISRGMHNVQEVNISEFNQFTLQPGDRIDIPEDKAIFVTGFVKNPGRYRYFIGFTVEDYIGLAGGNLENGDPSKANIQHINHIKEIGLHQQIQRGDIIYIPQRNLNKLVGKLSVLQIISYLASITLTYIAATR